MAFMILSLMRVRYISVSVMTQPHLPLTPFAHGGNNMALSVIHLPVAFSSLPTAAAVMALLMQRGSIIFGVLYVNSTD